MYNVNCIIGRKDNFTINVEVLGWHNYLYRHLISFWIVVEYKYTVVEMYVCPVTVADLSLQVKNIFYVTV